MNLSDVNLKRQSKAFAKIFYAKYPAAIKGQVISIDGIKNLFCFWLVSEEIILQEKEPDIIFDKIIEYFVKSSNELGIPLEKAKIENIEKEKSKIIKP